MGGTYCALPRTTINFDAAKLPLYAATLRDLAELNRSRISASKAAVAQCDRHVVEMAGRI